MDQALMHIKLVPDYTSKDLPPIPFCDPPLVNCLALGFKNGQRDIKLWARAWPGISSGAIRR
ncbi:hypothetical protein ELZ19_10440 [Brucella abortus]|uniref:Uncharacterized protein n=1 Tax=Brucella melitensis TaxID=29459 RepID=A0AB36PS75_BRUML|nr:hypothetical protein ADS42_016195 [Brucella melitensis]ASU73669.1 hypothetical protein CJP69_15980 [Brucella abortus]ATN19317.1 hypothetical protein CRN66_05695 [Brucella canis]ARY01280.1 hypothetical protein BK201_16340 [Brucella melitensis]ARY04470.1 hypothetical protein BK186_16350 [Brucella melitensis]